MGLGGVVTPSQRRYVVWGMGLGRVVTPSQRRYVVWGYRGRAGVWG